jgi:hypothetical protein
MLLIGDSVLSSAIANVRGHPRAFVQDFDRCRGGTNLDRFVNQVVRHTVKVRVEGHVIVDVDAGT